MEFSVWFLDIPNSFSLENQLCSSLFQVRLSVYWTKRTEVYLEVYLGLRPFRKYTFVRPKYLFLLTPELFPGGFFTSFYNDVILTYLWCHNGIIMALKTKHLHIILFLLIEPSTCRNFKVIFYNVFYNCFYNIFYKGLTEKSWYFKVRSCSWGYNLRLRVGTDLTF